MTQSELLENLDGPTLFQPLARKDKMEAQLIRYSGKKYLPNFPTLDEIVRENGDERLSAILENEIANHCDIPFMAIKNEGSTEKINGTYRYVLHLYGRLINGQKALVTLIDIQVFFDIHVPDGETPDECKEKCGRGFYF
ncbi:16535_t:CDS:2 [Dentiscutata erythropus]|uniref:16535_t:CDS:1 n=1 Tax=Dentiscutata erythropus TaxID=1348616 RepID=A0A9N9IRV4_9GLOM|nr:16535_t:CDS:2 [Dentiscutata erythropus]